MYFFDLHCDTICECAKDSKKLFDNDLAVSLKKGENIDKWVQTFALFIHDKYKGEDAKKQFEKLNTTLNNEIKMNNLNLFSCDENKNSLNIIKSIENSSFIGSAFELIEQISLDNFKMATLTWNESNVYAGGADSDDGLTALGFEAVEKFWQNGIIIDVSHLSDKSFYDLVKKHNAPIIASHSNARAVCNHRRNLTDEMLKIISDSGGIVGLNFYTLFLSENNPSIEDIIRHAEHILNICGEHALAIGSDFDGADMPENLKSIQDIEKLYQLMVQYFGKALTNKIFYENANGFFNKISINSKG